MAPCGGARSGGSPDPSAPSGRVAIEEELEHHIELLVEELMAEGWSRERAEDEAARRFGDRDRHRAACLEIYGRRRDADRRRSRLRGLRVDLAGAAHDLARHPRRLVLPALTLAIAMAALTLVLTVAWVSLVDPFDFPEPDRLYAIWERDLRDDDAVWVSPANLLDWQRHTRSFSALAAWDSERPVVEGLGEPRLIDGASVGAGFFEAVGLAPEKGRWFVDEELVPNGPRSVVISHELWQAELGGDPAILGTTLTIDHRLTTIVGIAPRELDFPPAARLWLPMSFDFDIEGSRGAHYLRVLARLDRGVSEREARDDLDAVAQALADQYPQNEHLGVSMTPLAEDQLGEARRPLGLLALAVAFLLAIASLNVAGLRLVDTWSRGRELAVLAALGASVGRIRRRLVSESVLMGVVAGALGLALALGLLPLVRGLLPGDLLGRNRLGFDPAVLGVVTLVTVVVGILVGFWPALRGAKRSTETSLLTRAGSVDRTGRRARTALVVVEVALAMVLVMAGGLLQRSFSRLMDVDPGFRAEQRLAFRVALPDVDYPESPDWRTAFVTLEERLGSIPGVHAVGMNPWLPLDPGWVFSYYRADRPTPAEGDQPGGALRFVNSSYFEAMGIAIVAGRPFGVDDREGTEPVVLVNESLVRKHFPDESPIGRPLVVGFGNPDDGPIVRTIVGVVADVRQYSLSSPAFPAVYVPYRQMPFSRMSFVLEVDGDPMAWQQRASAEVHAFDPSLVVEQPAAMTVRVRRSMASRTALLRLFSALAGIALLLAAIGLYGLLAQMVADQRREIGLRMALGATRGRIGSWIAARTLATTGLGIALGMVCAVPAGRLLEGLLFETSLRDAPVWTAAAALLLAVAAAAAWLPTLRAAKTDPMVVLRDD